MRWYLIKTWVGKEEELVKEIRRSVPAELYCEVFSIYNERVWRRQGHSLVHSEILFPGCVFITCRASETLRHHIEQIPVMAGSMTMGDCSMYPMGERDSDFLERISGEDHVIRLSHVLRMRDTGNLVQQQDRDNPVFLEQVQDNMQTKEFDMYRISGAVADFFADVESFDFKKRFAKVRKNLWGEEKTLVLGILLNEDIEQMKRHREWDTTVVLSNGYRTMRIEKDKEGKKVCTLAGN